MKRRLLAVVLYLAMLAPFTGIVSAQESTDVPEPTPVVIDDSGVGVDTVIVQPPAPTPAPDYTAPVFNLLAALLLVMAGGGGFALVWGRIQKDKQIKDNSERLFLGLAPQWQDTIHRVLDIADKAADRAQELLQFAKEITDGLPNVEAQVSTTALTIEEIESAAIDLGYTVAQLADGRLVITPPPNVRVALSENG